MMVVRRVALASMVAGALLQLGCTAILGDFTVGADAGDAGGSVDGNGGAEASSRDSGGMPPEEASTPDSTTSMETSTGTPHLTVDTPSIDFGIVTVGAVVTPQVVKITNVGTAPTAPLATQVTGAAAASFTFGLNSCSGAMLAPTSTCTISISVSTVAASTLAAMLTVSDGTSDVTQTSLAANVATPGALTLTPAPKDFGTVVLNGSSKDIVFTGQNTGGVKTGTITTTVGGTNAGDFITTMDTCNMMALAPQAMCAITMHMTPTGLNQRTATLSIAASPGGTAAASLTGTGAAAAAVTFMPPMTDFLDVALNTSAGPTTFTVTNVGGVTTSALATSVTGANASEFTLSNDTCTNQTLDPEMTCSVGVTFLPTARGPRAASLNVSGIPGMASASLAGTGEDFVTLTVKKSGLGNGTVTGDQINCGATCTEQVARPATTNPTVMLTATPDATSVFVSWSGGCTGSANPCTVTMSAAETVTANFAVLQYPVNFSMQFYGPATGSVSSSPAGISCAGPCMMAASYNAGSSVTLSVTSPDILVHWGGDCSGSGSCVLSMTQARTVSMTISAYNYVFTTLNGFNGNLGGQAGANAKCATAATTAGLPGTYKAWVATSATTAPANIGASARGWVRPDGLPFSDTVAGMNAGQIYYPASVTETGVASTNSVWTGSNGDGTFGGTAYDCTEWTSASGTVTGFAGSSTAGSGGWALSEGAGCSALFSLECFGVDLARAMSFTPATGRIAFLTKENVDPSMGLAGADTLCANEATSAGLTGTFVAFMATDTATAASRFSTAGKPWVRRDGIPVASTPANLMASDLLTSISQYADGTYINYNNIVRTGASSPTTVGTDISTCQNWMTNSSTFRSYVGDSANTTSSFFLSLSQTCDLTAPVYCLQL